MKDPQEIRRLYAEGTPIEAIARRLQISERRVRAILQQNGGMAEGQRKREERERMRDQELADAPEVEAAVEALALALEARYGPRFLSLIWAEISRYGRGEAGLKRYAERGVSALESYQAGVGPGHRRYGRM